MTAPEYIIFFQVFFSQRLRIFIRAKTYSYLMAAPETTFFQTDFSAVFSDCTSCLGRCFFLPKFCILHHKHFLKNYGTFKIVIREGTANLGTVSDSGLNQRETRMSDYRLHAIDWWSHDCSAKFNRPLCITMASIREYSFGMRLLKVDHFSFPAHQIWAHQDQS